MTGCAKRHEELYWPGGRAPAAPPTRGSCSCVRQDGERSALLARFLFRDRGRSRSRARVRGSGEADARRELINVAPDATPFRRSRRAVSVAPFAREAVPGPSRVMGLSSPGRRRTVSWDYRCTVRFGLGTGRTVLNFGDFANFTPSIRLGELPSATRSCFFVFIITRPRLAAYSAPSSGATCGGSRSR